MLIPPSDLKKDWIFEPVSVLHVGAHLGEEAEAYEAEGWVPVVWIEAQPELALELMKKLKTPTHRVINATVSDTSGIELDLKISSNSQSSSLLNFGQHKVDYPEITVVNTIKVTTTNLKTIFKSEKVPNFINLDIQGVELEALKGLGNLIADVDYVYTEVNYKEVYENCALVKDIDSYLIDFGFYRATTRWQIKKGWGDALYVRNKYKKPLRKRVKAGLNLGLFYSKQIYLMVRANLAEQKNALLRKNARKLV
jgi:FkbM family methyltransferase